MSNFLTIGMPTYKDFDGVYFTIQALRMYHDLNNVELLVVDTEELRAGISLLKPRGKVLLCNWLSSPEPLPKSQCYPVFEEHHWALNLAAREKGITFSQELLQLSPRSYALINVGKLNQKH